MAESIIIPRDSRYKDTKVHRDARGLSYGVYVHPVEFDTVSSAYQLHRVVASEVGFLDMIAVRYYGDGFERLWWSIAQVNRIIDPERDMRVGQTLVIPPRSAAEAYVSRQGVGDGSAA
jgi:nucleoid-associated protein YgaU